MFTKLYSVAFERFNNLNKPMVRSRNVKFDIYSTEKHVCDAILSEARNLTFFDRIDIFASFRQF